MFSSLALCVSLKYILRQENWKRLQWISYRYGWDMDDMEKSIKISDLWNFQITRKKTFAFDENNNINDDDGGGWNGMSSSEKKKRFVREAKAKNKPRKICVQDNEEGEWIWNGKFILVIIRKWYERFSFSWWIPNWKNVKKEENIKCPSIIKSENRFYLLFVVITWIRNLKKSEFMSSCSSKFHYHSNSNMCSRHPFWYLFIVFCHCFLCSVLFPIHLGRVGRDGRWKILFL